NRALGRKPLRHLFGERLQIHVLACHDCLVGKVTASDPAKVAIGQCHGALEIERSREHPPPSVFAHKSPSLNHELESVLEGQSPGRDERRVFTQTVTRGNGGLKRTSGLAAQRFEACKLMRNQSGLSETGKVQLASRIREAYLANVEREDVVRARVDLP